MLGFMLETVASITLDGVQLVHTFDTHATGIFKISVSTFAQATISNARGMTSTRTKGALFAGQIFATEPNITTFNYFTKNLGYSF